MKHLASVVKQTIHVFINEPGYRHEAVLIKVQESSKLLVMMLAKRYVWLIMKYTLHIMKCSTHIECQYEKSSLIIESFIQEVHWMHKVLVMNSSLANAVIKMQCITNECTLNIWINYNVAMLHLVTTKFSKHT